MAEEKDDFFFKFFPWEREEKPYFVNPEGFEWYIEKELLRYIRNEDRKGIKIDDIYPFFVRKGDDIIRVIIDGNQKILYESKSYESVLAYVDTLKLKKHFDLEEGKNEAIRERK